MKTDRIGGLGDGTPKEAERGGRLETPPPHPQAVAAPEGTQGGGEAKEGRQGEWGREAMNEPTMETLARRLDRMEREVRARSVAIQ